MASAAEMFPSSPATPVAAAHDAAPACAQDAAPAAEAAGAAGSQDSPAPAGTPPVPAAGELPTPCTPGLAPPQPLAGHRHSDCRSGRSYSLSGGDTPHTAPLPGRSTPPVTGRFERLSSLAEVRQERVGGRDDVTFVPFAMFRHGANRIHTKSAGWHSDGDVIILKEEISESSDGDMAVRPRAAMLTDSRRLELPLPERTLAEKGVRAFPGVIGPKAKAKRRRWKRAFFLDEDHTCGAAEGEDRQEARKGRLTKADFQELYCHRPATDFSFHDPEGPVQKKWAPFCEIGMDRQERLLAGMTRKRPTPATPTGAVEAPTPQQRLGRLAKPLRLELLHCSQKRSNYLPPVEQRIREYLEILRAAPKAEHAPLLLEFEDGYHRMLYHGVCTYYGLSSQSHNAEDGKRYTSAEMDPSCAAAALAAPLLQELLRSSAVRDPCTQQEAAHRRRRKGRR
eukprot:TRINITY_DN2251_c2_g1_i2.p1 TRINITY_DN2251_c2_g1~~TRINITY_DN2251_c2_g1_i2.p1  ORF type:complete len:485 (+),score=163.93 TRINITY_DN2251_c2_g1_i2:101-1456(+)